MSETQKIGYVASGPILSSGSQSARQLARGPIVDQNCMLAGIVILLNQKVYYVNVYARMSLNRLFSDTIYQLMWARKRYWCVSVVPRPCRGPAFYTNIRSDTKGTTFHFTNERKKLKRKCNNYEYQQWVQSIQVKAWVFRPFWCCCCACVRTSHQAKSYWDGATALSDSLVPFWCKEYICVLYPAVNVLLLVRRYKTK